MSPIACGAACRDAARSHFDSRLHNRSNDGFGGGSEVTENLLWNTCRESSDHANFNSWDRQPFWTDVLYGNGTGSLTPAFNTIHHVSRLLACSLARSILFVERHV